MGKRGFASAVIGFLLTVRDGHPTTPIVVTSPIFGTWRETLGPSKAIFAPDEGQTGENENQMLMSLQETRSQLKGVVEMLRGRGDSNLHYRDGLELLGEVSNHPLARTAGIHRTAPHANPPLHPRWLVVAHNVGCAGGRGVAFGGRLAPEP